MLDDAAFGAATEVTPKFISPADPAARWTGAHGGQAFFAYSTNYLVDVDNAIIVDVEAVMAAILNPEFSSGTRIGSNGIVFLDNREGPTADGRQSADRPC